jgi:putative DNA primase/helicase
VVLVGTTNQLEYFKDSTGNRRFWPIKCIGSMELDALREMREQLFAEAVHRYRSGERRFPSREEQTDVIGPEQESREIGDAWDEGIHHYLASGDATGLKPDQRNPYPGVSVYDVLVHGLKIDAGKLTKDMMTRVGIAMRKMGWEKVERRDQSPRYIYKRPMKSASETSVAMAQGANDDLPI